MSQFYRTLPRCHYWADQTAGSLAVGIFEAGTRVEVLERDGMVKVTTGAVTGWVSSYAIEAVEASPSEAPTVWERLLREPEL